jgi:hypothetical protein
VLFICFFSQNRARAIRVTVTREKKASAASLKITLFLRFEAIVWVSAARMHASEIILHISMNQSSVMESEKVESDARHFRLTC